MPYGMPGGDTPSNTKWMEDCVTKIMKGGKDKPTAIAICKSTWMKMQKNPHKAAIAIGFYLNNLEKEKEQGE